MSSNLRKSQEGFTLLEVIVALTIVAIGILATLAASNFNQRASDTNQRTAVATNLAREGIEAVRNIRDSDWAVRSQQPPGTPQNQLQAFDCAPSGSLTGGAQGGVSVPYPCDFHLATDARANYTLIPQMGNGTWSLVRNLAAGNGTTQSAAYALCPSTSGTVNYTPIGATSPCPNGEGAYYRRVLIGPGRDSNGAGNPQHQKSIYVQVSVSWAGRKGPDVVLEEYLTDWRKF